MNHRCALLAALLLTATLTSCAAQPQATPTESVTPTHEHVEEVVPAPTATWDTGSESTAEATTSKVIRLFGRPQVPQKTWYRDLKPFLGKDYAESAAYTDPATVPFRKVLEGPVLSREMGNPSTVTVGFITDAGRWDVLLHRSGQGAPWLVMQISAHQGD